MGLGHRESVATRPLTLWSKRKVERCATSCNRDQTIIYVNYGDGVWRQIYYKDGDDPSPATPTWEQLSFNLTPPSGLKTGQIRMRFQSASTMNNDFYGWSFDDVSVVG